MVTGICNCSEIFLYEHFCFSVQMTSSEVVSKLFSIGGERSQSPASTIGDEEGSSGSVWSYSITLDQDVSKMENVLDHWTAELKKNVLVG